MENDNKWTPHMWGQRLWKKINSNPTVFRRLCVNMLLLGVLTLSFGIRTQDMARIPAEQFVSNDAYLYYWQAQNINQHGSLLARDMHRWHPWGRDNGQLLPLYAYTLAYMHKAINLFYSEVTLYQLQLYAPVVCWTIGFAALLIFLIQYYGTLITTIVGVLLSTFPGNIIRSSAGFGDRDAFVWMLAMLALLIYLYKERMPSGHHRTLTTGFCGFIVFLGGLSWEAFGIFVLIILSIELWKFCTTDAEYHLKEYCLWVLMFGPWLYILSPAYRGGYGFSTHIAALMLVPALGVLALRWIRWMLLRFVPQLRSHAQQIAWALTLIGITVAGCYVLLQYNTFSETAFAFMESSLMKTVAELKDPIIRDWIYRYGGMFILGSIGLSAITLFLWKWNAVPLVTGLALLCTTVFLREPIETWTGGTAGNYLFMGTVVLSGIGMAIMATCKQQKKRYDLEVIALLAWTLIWISLARNGLRYVFFLGMPLAIGTAALLKHITTTPTLNRTHLKCFGKTLHPKLVTGGLTLTILALLLFWKPVGGYAVGTLQAAAKREATPGQGTHLHAFEWIKNELPSLKMTTDGTDTPIIAAHWTYGSQLNVHARIRTIIDQDHFIPHKIHLYFRHLFCAQSEIEALHFLKAHQATHLMITSSEIAPNAKENSLVGSDANLDRYFTLLQLNLLPTAPGIQYSLEPKEVKTPHLILTNLTQIDVTGNDIENFSINAVFGKEPPVKLPYVAFAGDKRILPTKTVNTEKGGLLLLFDTDKVLRNSFYIPEIGWNSIAVKLFLRGEHSNAFQNVLTVPKTENLYPDIQIWKINYPENITVHPKYLSAGPIAEERLKKFLDQKKQKNRTDARQ